MRRREKECVHALAIEMPKTGVAVTAISGEQLLLGGSLGQRSRDLQEVDSPGLGQGGSCTAAQHGQIPRCWAAPQPHRQLRSEKPLGSGL